MKVSALHEIRGKMPSRSPSRRSSPLTHHSRDSSHRSPSFGMRGTSRRGRSPPSDTRRRKILPRGGGTRTGEGAIRGHRSSEFRSIPRSIPPGGYQQGQYSAVPTRQISPPRRATGSKRRSFSPSMPVIPSTSGLKRKRLPHPRSSSTSSSSLNSPPRPQHRHQVIKMKKLSVERIAASREPPVVVPMRKRSRSKSPVRERSHVSRAESHTRFSMRATESSLSGEVKAGSYSVGVRPAAAKVGNRGFDASSRQHENPQKRFMAEPVVRYGVGGDEGRPVYRGPEGKGPASFSERELKKITVGILRSIPADEPQINRQIVKPEDVVVVRRPGGPRLESISPTPMAMERCCVSPSPPPHSRQSGRFVRRTREYEESGLSRAHPGTSSQARHKEGSRRNDDLRYELENRRRDDASNERGSHEFRGDSDGASSDLRMRINEKRTTDHHRISHYHGDDDDDAVGVHSKVVSDRRYAMEHHHMEGPHEPRRRGAERGGGHRMSARGEEAEHEEFNPRGSFLSKSGSSVAPSWDGNPEYVPKGRAYYEHDNRDEWVRMSGGPRGGRGQYAVGNRGRFFRGGFVQRGRGRGRGRGLYMGHVNRGYVRGGSGGGIRRPTAHVTGVGGGNSSRGKPSSPSLWKHDMFENLSSDENRPTSTASDTKR